MKLGIRCAAFLAVAALLFCPVARSDDDGQRGHSASILGQLPTSPQRIVSTVPANGDVNPYGVAFVPEDFREGGPLEPGDILISNFNNNQNQQGTGTTIVRITPGGQLSVFFQGQPGLGLTTVLGVLRRGFVLVGNLPTTDGTSATVQQGSLLVLNRFGAMVANLSDSTLLNGPWDLTLIDGDSNAHIFVSSVLSGTVTRLDVSMPGDQFNVDHKTQIGSGYTHGFDPNALVIGPTGLAYDRERNLLYVASTGDNKIFAIADARSTNHDGGQGRMVYQDATHLHGPLGLALARNGHLITANGDAVNSGGTQNALVEFTREGKFVAQYQVDSGSPGGAFGLAFGGSDDEVRFAAVDDVQNTLKIWTLGE
jgi:hypothetical protein